MDKLTTEQGEIVLVAISKIVCALAAIQKGTDIQKWIGVKNEAMESLKNIGVPI